MTTILRDQVAIALTAEHYRRANQQIVASPEEHQAAFANIAIKAVAQRLQRILDTEPASDDHLGIERVIELLEER